MYYKIFIAIFFLLFSVRCSEVQPILNTTCDITEEICYYANLICENFNPHESTFKNSNSLNNDLQIVVAELKKESDQIVFSKKNKSTAYDFNLNYRLIQIRNDLKKIYENQKKE